MSSPVGFPLASSLGGNGLLGLPEGEAADLFGVDLLFQQDGLDLTPKGDIATVGGIENLRRAIWRRLSVRPGEYRLRPEYGVGIQTYLKKSITKAAIDEIKHRIADNLSRERRIEKILKITVVEIVLNDRPGVAVTISVQAKGQNLTFQPFAFTSPV